MSNWQTINSLPRHVASEVTGQLIPTEPGVYAWYRSGVAVYVGKATGRQGLRQRAWGNHMARGKGAMSGSAFRRNVAELLGFGKPSLIKANPSVLTDAQVDAVNAWIRECEVAWFTTASSGAALALERDLKAELLPPLTKR